MKRSASGDMEKSKNHKSSLTPGTIPTTATERQRVVLTLGYNPLGQMGFDTNVEVKYKPAIVTSIENDVENICAGGMHTLCITSDGRVITFGMSGLKEFGWNASNPNEWHTLLFVDLEGKAIQVSAGFGHSAVLLDNGKVFAWGTFSFSRTSNGMIVGPNGKAIQADVPVEMLPGVTVVKIASGADHLVMLTEDGRLFTCGCGTYGQLGREVGTASGTGSRQRISQLLTPGEVPALGNEVTDMWATQQATFAKIQDEIYACGRNDYSQLGMGDTENRFHMVKANAFNNKSWEQICGGAHHLIARDDHGVVYALGRFNNGRLGLGAAVSRHATELTIIPVLANKKCIDISCYNDLSFAVTAGGMVYGWGWGAEGRLGNGKDDRPVQVPRLVGGKQLATTRPIRVSAGGIHTVILATK